MTRMGSSSSCSTLQTGASQVLGRGGGQRAGVVAVTGFLTMRVLGVWAGGYFILSCEWLIKVDYITFPGIAALLGVGRWWGVRKRLPYLPL